MKKNYDKMTDQDIRIAMLEALRSEDLAEGRRLQKARHKLIDSETAVQHELIDSAFMRFWNVSPIKPKEHRIGKTTENQDLAGVVACTCKRGFSSWEGLERHINKHKGEK